MKRILFATPMPFGPRWGYWTRDAGLVVLALREMGFDAWLVALGNASTETEGMPVLPISLAEMQSASWWKAQRPDAVVLSTWSAPRHDPIRRAALAATSRVVERLDTDGARSARLYPSGYFQQAWGAYAERLPWLGPLAAIPALAKTGLFYSFPSLMDGRMAASMKMLPALIAESPIAAERIQHLLTTFAGAPHRVVVIPSPVNEAVFHADATTKENRIISVGRWASRQKDYPILREVLREFLTQHPDWQATVVGSGVPARDRSNNGESWLQCVTFHDHLEPEQLAAEYRRARIYLMVSRFESFCIAAAESLCCGCSVVGSEAVPSSHYFADSQSGCVSETRTVAGFSRALDAEAADWAAGNRNPNQISALWLGRAGAKAVARTTIDLLQTIS